MVEHSDYKILIHMIWTHLPMVIQKLGVIPENPVCLLITKYAQANGMVPSSTPVTTLARIHIKIENGSATMMLTALSTK